jgi:hypothetical protein
VRDLQAFPGFEFILLSKRVHARPLALAIFFVHAKCVLSSSPLESVFRLPLRLERVEQLLHKRKQL